jgi:hypothetical protein
MIFVFENGIVAGRLWANLGRWFSLSGAALSPARFTETSAEQEETYKGGYGGSY